MCKKLDKLSVELFQMTKLKCKLIIRSFTDDPCMIIREVPKFSFNQKLWEEIDRLGVENWFQNAGETEPQIYFLD